MKLLELFCGTKSITKVFNDHCHDTYTVDFEESMNPDLCIDVLDLTAEMILEKFGRPDVMWCSPPCTKFSVASIGRNWIKHEDGSVESRNNDAEIAKQIVIHTIKLIKELNPTYWFIENPRGMLRKMLFMQELPRYTVTYCQYGDTRMKPTDIWTNHPNPEFKPTCNNGDPCHVSAPRGSRTGTQGLKNAEERGVIPVQLCEHICKICEEFIINNI
ncbi:MAG TPA: DNA methyltransferase [Clostridiales bacterium]|nr:DNA methyltransferase [Clostridiales bacterium]